MDFKAITDVAHLRQIAVMQDKELGRLLQVLREQQEELARLKGEDAAALQLKLELLQAQINRSQRAMFGSTSERRGRMRRPPVSERAGAHGNTGGDAGGQADASEGSSSEPTLSTPETLPLVFELPADACQCPACGEAMRPMQGGFETSDVVDVIERRYVVHQVQRQKYHCTCKSAVVTAPVPLERSPIVPGGRYSVDFAIAVAIDKYEQHLPLHRQRAAMKQRGLDIDTQVLFEQCWHLGDALCATYDALPGLIRSAPWLHIDETTWPVMDGNKPHKWQVWAMNSTDAAYYRILDSRGTDAAVEMLDDTKAIVLCDGLASYESAARRKGYTLAGCWVHARRPLVEVEADFPEATPVLDWIDTLFRIEREVPLLPAETLLERRAAARAEFSRPIVEQILAWAEANADRVPRKIGVQPGAAFIHAQRNRLRLFLERPFLPLSNNPAEQRCRSPVLGRKNHYGSRSKRGTVVAAMFYSLIETARMNGLCPTEYLREVVRRDRRQPGTVTLVADLCELAPTRLRR
jgi:transposase